MERKHSDVLIAGLILVGATMWLGSIVSQLAELGRIPRLVIWFCAAFSATQIARRLLADLDFEETAIAAVVSMAVVAGVFSRQHDEAMNVDILMPIGTTLAGATVGALTSRYRRPEAAKIWLVLGGGFAAYGAAVLAVGISMLADGTIGGLGTAVIVGSLSGCFVAALFTNVRGRHCAIGLGLVLGSLLAIAGPHAHSIERGLLGLGTGIVLGAIGGGIGGRINAMRKPRPKLPEAHVQ